MDSALPQELSTKQVRELFNAAYELPESEQEVWIASQVSHSPKTREAAMRLLRGSRRAGGFLSEPILHAHPDPQREGMQIGAYRITRELGAGGMGVVYLCERIDGMYQRRLALKVLRSTHNSAAMRERFSAERVILAKLDHENIARIVDGGTTADGMPYLLMDYVEGEPIDTFCRKHGLGLLERLALFRKVCSAVQYLHEQGVLHSDLKPSNILVHVDGRVKLLDFGIAKLLDENRRSAGVSQGVMGTADYISPEQIEGRPAGPEADVYSLGVILFELLALKRPFQSDSADSVPAMLAVRSTPLVPMSAIAALSSSPWSTSLRGDLDQIAAVALSRSPADRYASVSVLDGDLRRFLAHEPVLARRNTPLYVARQFLRRHWQMSIAVTLVVLALAGTGWAVTDMLEMRANVEQEVQTQREMERAYRAQLTQASNSMSPEAVRARIRWVHDNYAERIAPMLEDPLAPRHDIGVLAAKSVDFLAGMAPVALRDPETARDLVDAYVGISELQWSETKKSLGDPAAAHRTAKIALDSANTLLLTPDGRHRLTLLLPQIAHQLRLSAQAAARSGQ